MKIQLFFLLSIFCLGSMYSQEINCLEKLNQLSSVISDKDFKNANELLIELRQKKCANYSEKIYQTGIEVLQYNIDLADADEKENKVNELVKLYNEYDYNFPENTNGNSVKKAMLYYDYKVGKENEIYTLLDKGIFQNKSEISNANAFYVYFKLFLEKYLDKNNAIPFDKWIEKYTGVISSIEKNANHFPEKLVEFNNAKMVVNSIADPFLTLENLSTYASENFENNKLNAKWLENFADLLVEKGASKPVFGKLATQLDEINPTSKSSYLLGVFNLNNQNQDKAIAYFEKSITLTDDKLDKATTYYKIGSLLMVSDKPKAKKMIQNAIDNNSTNGKYYILLANLYANSVSECSSTTIEKKAIYQLAIQTAQKAATVEVFYKSTVEGLIKEFSKNPPSKKELETIKKAGNTVTIGCWINETVLF